LQAERNRDGKIVDEGAEAAPSLCMSMKISPRRPSSYSPVRKYTLWPPTTAFWV
jgi:hypothetical protein